MIEKPKTKSEVKEYLRIASKMEKYQSSPGPKPYTCPLGWGLPCQASSQLDDVYPTQENREIYDLVTFGWFPRLGKERVTFLKYVIKNKLEEGNLWKVITYNEGKRRISGDAVRIRFERIIDRILKLY